jgi:hypothetical protein
MMNGFLLTMGSRAKLAPGTFYLLIIHQHFGLPFDIEHCAGIFINYMDDCTNTIGVRASQAGFTGYHP